MTSGGATVAVLIPTHGEPSLLKGTLDSVSRCELPEGFDELVVIENGSEAGVKAVVNDLPERLSARYMHRSRGNKSYALNQALETIEAELVVFFDDDVRVHPKTLAAYAEAASGHAVEGAFFGGTVKVNREVEPPSWLEPSLPDSARGYVADGSRSGKYYLGFNWAAFRKDIQQLGGFDTRLGPGSKGGGLGDETDLQERMQAAGISPIDVPKAIVTHYVPKECCTVQWALQRYYKSGKAGYYKSGGGIGMVGKALKDAWMGGLLAVKSTLTGKLASIVFGVARIWAAVGIVYAFWQDGMPLLIEGE